MRDDALDLMVTKTVSGAIASFDDGGEDVPVKSCVINIEPVQSGSGDPSPTNIREISGWTGVNVIRTGKNLFDKSSATDGKAVKSNGSITDKSNVTLSDYICVFPNTNYYIYNSFGATDYSTCVIYDSNKAFLRNINLSGTDRNGVINTGDNAAFIRVNFRVAYKDFAMLEIGLSASEYVPYKGTTYHLTFPTEAGTVYGGTLDVTRGVLTVDRAVFSITQSTQIQSQGSGHNGNYRVRYDLPYTGANKNAIAYSHGVPVTRNSASSNYPARHGAVLLPYNTNASILQLGMSDYSVSSAEEYAAWLAANGPLHVLYELATPQTYQLTPTDLRTLLGQNNIWADTGNISLTYRADATLLYNKLLQEVAS